MAADSSILAWRIPRTEEPGGLQSIGLQKVRHNWSDWAHILNKRGSWASQRLNNLPKVAQVKDESSVFITALHAFFDDAFLCKLSDSQGFDVLELLPRLHPSDQYPFLNMARSTTQWLFYSNPTGPSYSSSSTPVLRWSPWPALPSFSSHSSKAQQYRKDSFPLLASWESPWPHTDVSRGKFSVLEGH